MTAGVNNAAKSPGPGVVIVSLLASRRWPGVDQPLRRLALVALEVGVADGDQPVGALPAVPAAAPEVMPTIIPNGVPFLKALTIDWAPCQQCRGSSWKGGRQWKCSTTSRWRSVRRRRLNGCGCAGRTGRMEEVVTGLVALVRPVARPKAGYDAELAGKYRQMT